jgi:hypothetical protein
VVARRRVPIEKLGPDFKMLLCNKLKNNLNFMLTMAKKINEA